MKRRALWGGSNVVGELVTLSSGWAAPKKVRPAAIEQYRPTDTSDCKLEWVYENAPTAFGMTSPLAKVT